jgi:hypothetical protein
MLVSTPATLTVHLGAGGVGSRGNGYGEGNVRGWISRRGKDVWVGGEGMRGVGMHAKPISLQPRIGSCLNIKQKPTKIGPLANQANHPAKTRVVSSGSFKKKGFLRLLQEEWFPQVPSGRMVSSGSFRKNGFLRFLQEERFPQVPSGRMVSSGSFRKNGFLRFLQEEWFPQVPSGRMVSSGSFRKNGFLRFLQEEWFPQVPSGRMVSSGSFRKNGFLRFLQGFTEIPVLVRVVSSDSCIVRWVSLNSCIVRGGGGFLDSK